MSEETLELYNLPETSILDDVYINIFNRIRMIMLNKALMMVTVITQNGVPFPGVSIDNLTDENGDPVFSDERGNITGFVTEGEITLSATDYIDFSDWSKSYNFIKGEGYRDQITLEVRNYFPLSVTKNIRISNNVETLSYSVSGSGSNGTPCRLVSSDKGYYNSGYPGRGGNAGDSVVVNKAVFVPNKYYAAAIGSGGGSSSIFETVANGGSTATENGVGGDLNGTAGSKKYYSGYNTLSLCGGGGGRGGTTNLAGENPPGSGGAPFGGAGGTAIETSSSNNYLLNGKDALSVSGGGGGGAVNPDGTKNAKGGQGGKGGPGLIAFSMELKVK